MVWGMETLSAELLSSGNFLLFRAACRTWTSWREELRPQKRGQWCGGHKFWRSAGLLNDMIWIDMVCYSTLITLIHISDHLKNCLVMFGGDAAFFWSERYQVAVQKDKIPNARDERCNIFNHPKRVAVEVQSLNFLGLVAWEGPEGPDLRIPRIYFDDTPIPIQFPSLPTASHLDVSRVDAASGLLEKAVEKRASLALLGDADKKVREHGLSTENAWYESHCTNCADLIDEFHTCRSTRSLSYPPLQDIVLY